MIGLLGCCCVIWLFVSTGLDVVIAIPGGPAIQIPLGELRGREGTLRVLAKQPKYHGPPVASDADVPAFRELAPEDGGEEDVLPGVPTDGTQTADSFDGSLGEEIFDHFDGLSQAQVSAVTHAKVNRLLVHLKEGSPTAKAVAVGLSPGGGMGGPVTREAGSDTPDAQGVFLREILDIREEEIAILRELYYAPASNIMILEFDPVAWHSSPEPKTYEAGENGAQAPSREELDAQAQGDPLAGLLARLRDSEDLDWYEGDQWLAVEHPDAHVCDGPDDPHCQRKGSAVQSPAQASVQAEQMPAVNDPFWDAQWGMDTASGIPLGISAVGGWAGAVNASWRRWRRRRRGDREPQEPAPPAPPTPEPPAPPTPGPVPPFTGAVIVAIVDTGVDLTHPDLKNMLWTNPDEENGRRGYDDDRDGFVDDVHGYDFFLNTGDVTDTGGHGTHVAGIVAAEANNNIAIAGVSRNAELMALRFLGPQGGVLSDAIRAMDYALRHGAQVINCSWGQQLAPSQAFGQMISVLEQRNVLVVVAAGNRESNQNLDLYPYYPASLGLNYTNMLIVAASVPQGRLASFSNYSPRIVHVAAPGSQIISTWPGDQVAVLDGTSMAAPFVSGIAAELFGLPSGRFTRTLTPADIVRIITASATRVPALSSTVASSGVANFSQAVKVANSAYAAGSRLGEAYGTARDEDEGDVTTDPSDTELLVCEVTFLDGIRCIGPGADPFTIPPPRDETDEPRTDAYEEDVEAPEELSVPIEIVPVSPGIYTVELVAVWAESLGDKPSEDAKPREDEVSDKAVSHDGVFDDGNRLSSEMDGGMPMLSIIPLIDASMVIMSGGSLDSIPTMGWRIPAIQGLETPLSPVALELKPTIDGEEVREPKLEGDQPISVSFDEMPGYLGLEDFARDIRVYAEEGGKIATQWTTGVPAATRWRLVAPSTIDVSSVVSGEGDVAGTFKAFEISCLPSSDDQFSRFSTVIFEMGPLGYSERRDEVKRVQRRVVFECDALPARLSLTTLSDEEDEITRATQVKGFSLKVGMNGVQAKRVIVTHASVLAQVQRGMLAGRKLGEGSPMEIIGETDEEGGVCDTQCMEQYGVDTDQWPEWEAMEGSPVGIGTGMGTATHRAVGETGLDELEIDLLKEAQLSVLIHNLIVNNISGMPQQFDPKTPFFVIESGPDPQIRPLSPRAPESKPEPKEPKSEPTPQRSERTKSKPEPTQQKPRTAQSKPEPADGKPPKEESASGNPVDSEGESLRKEEEDMVNNQESDEERNETGKGNSDQHNTENIAGPAPAPGNLPGDHKPHGNTGNHAVDEVKAGAHGEETSSDDGVATATDDGKDSSVGRMGGEGRGRNGPFGSAFLKPLDDRASAESVGNGSMDLLGGFGDNVRIRRLQSREKNRGVPDEWQTAFELDRDMPSLMVFYDVSPTPTNREHASVVRSPESDVEKFPDYVDIELAEDVKSVKLTGEYVKPAICNIPPEQQNHYIVVVVFPRPADGQTDTPRPPHIGLVPIDPPICE